MTTSTVPALPVAVSRHPRSSTHSCHHKAPSRFHRIHRSNLFWLQRSILSAPTRSTVRMTARPHTASARCARPCARREAPRCHTLSTHNAPPQQHHPTGAPRRRATHSSVDWSPPHFNMSWSHQALKLRAHQAIALKTSERRAAHKCQPLSSPSAQPWQHLPTGATQRSATLSSMDWSPKALVSNTQATVQCASRQQQPAWAVSTANHSLSRDSALPRQHPQIGST